MNNIILFANSFLSYFFLFLFIVVLVVIACVIGVKWHKNKVRKAAHGVEESMPDEVKTGIEQ